MWAAVAFVVILFLVSLQIKVGSLGALLPENPSNSKFQFDPVQRVTLRISFATLIYLIVF